MDAEVRRDEELLTDVLRMLEEKTPLHAWRPDAVAALAEAVTLRAENAIEDAKAQRLERHLFAGPPPVEIARIPAVPSRRADRLRADLADLVSYGAGLHLLADLG